MNEEFKFFDAEYNLFDRGVAIDIAAGETVSFKAYSYLENASSWTFTFGEALENDENYDQPEIEYPLGSEENAHYFYYAMDYDLSVEAETVYYIVLEGALQFVVPEGFTAMTGGFNHQEFAAGETLAFSDYHPMMNAQLYVMLSNTTTEAKEITLTVSEISGGDEGGDVGGEETASGTIQVATTQENTYGWEFETPYTFTAETAGTYVFTIPSSLGFFSKAQYDLGWDGMPELDYNLVPAGGEVEFTLAAGEDLVFYVGSTLASDAWFINWTVKADEGGDVGGEETPSGTIQVATTQENTYGWEFETPYTFTAETAGTYVFTIPSSLGFFSKAQYDLGWDGMPELDYNLVPAGGEVEFTLAAGEDLVFYVGSTLASDAWFINWAVKAEESGDVGGEEVSTVLDVGDNTIVITEADLEVGGVIYTFTAPVTGQYTFASNDLGARVFTMNMEMIGTGMVNLTADETYTVFVMGAAAGEYVLTVVAPEATPQLHAGVNTITISETDLESGVTYTYTAPTTGQYTFASNDLFAVVYDSNNMMVGRGIVNLTAGETYNVVLGAMAAGTYTVTLTVPADGSSSNPFVIESVPTTLSINYSGAGQVWHTYVAEATGNCVFTFEISDTWLVVEDTSKSVWSAADGYNQTSYVIPVVAGETYTILIGTWSENGVAQTINVSIAMEEAAA